ncbi:MAG: hypothetical protein JO093_13725 [Acidobacteria bacterium]|nr:hypothetical protein [Acidobacteriota bacterium]MBV9068525.1 hypothetical protein [Acidobacteriota bacterium]MBV9186673.1 hypothetical protein [Acidobacteriota bacterium]
MPILQLDLTAVRIAFRLNRLFAAAALIVISVLMQSCEPVMNDEPTCCCLTKLGYTRMNKDQCNKKYGYCVDDKSCSSSSLDIIESHSNRWASSRTGGLSESSILMVAGRPQAGANRTIAVDGSRYADGVRDVRNSLREAISANRAYPISGIIKSLPLDANPALLKALADRGSITFIDATASNTGPVLRMSFKDTNLGSIAVYFPQTLTAGVQVTQEDLRFLFPDPPTVLLSGVASKYQIPSNQRLDGLTLREHTATYFLHSAADPDIRLTISVSLDPPTV